MKQIGIAILDMIEKRLNEFADSNFFEVNELLNELRRLLMQQSSRLDDIFESLRETARQFQEDFKEINLNLDSLNTKVQEIEKLPVAWKANLEKQSENLINRLGQINELLGALTLGLMTFRNEFKEWTRKSALCRSQTAGETFTNDTKQALNDLKSNLNNLNENCQKIQAGMDGY